MKQLLLLILLSSSAQAMDCNELLLKVQNQFYHMKTGRFIWLRTLHELLRSTPTERKWVYLWQLHPLHPMDYKIKATQKKLERRQTIMDMFHDEILLHGLSIPIQNDLLPSTQPIQVLPLEDKSIVKNGNSRIESLYRTFGWEDLRVEIEEYKTINPIVPYLVHRARQAGELEQ